MVETANTIWADGPVDNPTQPDKADIREWGSDKETRLDAAEDDISALQSDVATLQGDVQTNDAAALRGLKVEVISASQVQITTASGINVTADLTASGANGLDTGSEGSSAWYHVWLIWHDTTFVPAGLLSLSATAPTLPAGYTRKLRVGAVRNDGSSNLWRTVQYGRRAQVKIGTNPTTVNVAATGSAGNTNTPTWVGVSLANYVPPTAFVVHGHLSNGANASNHAIVAPNNSYGGQTSTTNPPIIAASTTQSGVAFSLVLESSSIYWAANNASNTLSITGWEDNI